MLKEKIDAKKQYTDWMGNFIEEGTTIVIIRIYSYFSDKFNWENRGEYKIIKVGDDLMYNIHLGEFTITVDLSFIDFGYPPIHIVCIKGISDDKDKYMQLNNINE